MVNAVSVGISLKQEVLMQRVLLAASHAGLLLQMGWV